jgi:hypothetical protein
MRPSITVQTSTLPTGLRLTTSSRGSLTRTCDTSGTTSARVTHDATVRPTGRMSLPGNRSGSSQTGDMVRYGVRHGDSPVVRDRVGHVRAVLAAGHTVRVGVHQGYSLAWWNALLRTMIGVRLPSPRLVPSRNHCPTHGHRESWCAPWGLEVVGGLGHWGFRSLTLSKYVAAQGMSQSSKPVALHQPSPVPDAIAQPGAYQDRQRRVPSPRTRSPGPYPPPVLKPLTCGYALSKRHLRAAEPLTCGNAIFPFFEQRDSAPCSSIPFFASKLPDNVLS